MMRFNYLNKRLVYIVVIVTTLIVFSQVFVNKTNEGVQAISSNSYSIEGTIGYQNDNDWKSVIRQREFDCEKMSLDLYSGDTLIQNVSLQSTSIDDNYHLSFIHNGDGGGNYIISNIPKIVNEKSVTKCKVRVKGVSFYSDIASNDIVFDSSEAMPYVNLKLAPKTMPLKINVQVRGDDDSTSPFTVKVTGTNTVSSESVISSSATKSVNVIRDSAANSTGSTIYVPLGLQYNICEVPGDDYAVLSYNLSYLNNSGAETTL